jgi:predicted nucleic acid-binding protein
MRAGGLFIAPAVFEIEIAAAISRVTKDPNLAGKQLSQLHRLSTRGVLRFVSIEENVIKGATALARDHGLRALDAMYAAVAQHLKIALLTFDTELLSIPQAVIATVRP